MAILRLAERWVSDFAQILKADGDSGDCLDADAFSPTSILKLEETAIRVSKAANSSNSSVFKTGRHTVLRSARPVHREAFCVAKR
jgi:hypothetical protein